jgi:arsenate reductase-like glutaredoxin family protein
VHDIRKNPLNVRQLSGILRHFDLEHFISPQAKSKNLKKMDTSSANRREILELMAADIGLLQKPIIVSGRLMTMGCDRRTISDMLQLKIDESSQECRAESAA